MATNKQKQQIYNNLSWTSRDYFMCVRGYGGEMSIGSLNKRQFNYWNKKGEEHMIEHMTGFDEGTIVPHDMQLVNNAEWYEGNIDHISGAEMTESSLIEVIDEHGDTIWACELCPGILEDQGIDVETVGWTTYRKEHQYAWLFQSHEKGQFFYTPWTLTQPFDHKKITIQTYEVEGIDWLVSVAYEGEELDGSAGWDTTGKGFYGTVYEVGK